MYIEAIPATSITHCGVLLNLTKRFKQN